MSPSHQFSKSHLHLLQVHCFLQIFPGKRKMVLQGWPHCQPPCALPDTMQRCGCPRDAGWPCSSWQHCLLSCPVPSGAVPPSPWHLGSTSCSFHSHKDVTVPQMYKLSCGEVLQRPWKRRTRGENLHILFQIPRASQDSLPGVCVLFILGDDTRYLSRFKCSMHWDCSRPLGPSRVWGLLLQQHRLSEGSSAGPAARAAPCRH